MRKGRTIKICGTVVNQQGKTIPFTRVHLLKKIRRNRYTYYEEVAEVYSNEQGYYEFNLENWYHIGEYRVVILKNDTSEGVIR